MAGHEGNEHGHGEGPKQGHGPQPKHSKPHKPCVPEDVVYQDVYLRIEEVPGYSPVEPTSHPGSYRKDCMRNPGHEDGTIPAAEVEARRLDALVYREYLDPGYLIPKPDKLVLADVTEPLYPHRVPGTVIWTQPGRRLRVHVLNAGTMPHSLHVHGLRYGVDSDGSWPLGTQSSDGRRSDEICPGESWTYVFDVEEDMVGAWPFHDHARMIGESINRGLFGGIVVLPREHCEYRCGPELPPLVRDYLAERMRERGDEGPLRHVTGHTHGAHHHVAAAAKAHGGAAHGGTHGGAAHGGAHGPAVRPAAGGHRPKPARGAGHHGVVPRTPEEWELQARLAFLEEWAQLDYAHPRCHDDDVLHVPLFVHFMASGSSTPAFDSGQLAPGGTPFEVTFGTDATFDYHCEIHPSMQGRVVVAPGEPPTADVFIVDSPGPMAFSPAEVRVAPGGTVTWRPGTITHTVTENGGGLPTWCVNGRSFVGNTPTIAARPGQRIRWYVFNLDVGMMWHNFHTHGQKWTFAGEPSDTRSIGPAESFVVETVVPDVLLLPPEIAATQPEKCRPRGAKPYDLRGDFLFHCHVEMHMMQGLAGIVRVRQRLWLTGEQYELLAADRGLPLDDGTEDCPPVDLTRCESAGCGEWVEIPGSPEVAQMHLMLLPGTTKVLYWGYGDTRDDLSRIWDSATNTYTAPANQPFDVTSPPNDRGLANLWSAEHGYFPDTSGKVLVHGGFTPRESYTFDPATETWARTAPTADERFYATSLSLADGKILTFFGSASRSIEVYDPAAGTWSPPKAVPPPFTYLYYPWTYQLPGGDLFVAGPTGEARRFDWTPDPVPAGTAYPTIAGNRSTGGEKGTSVLLPLRLPGYAPSVLIAGGDLPAAESTSEVIDLSAPSPAWTALPDLNVPRREQVNTVLLPDGRVFLAGGVDGPDGGPVEMFDPRDPDAGWQLCATMAWTRGYHSAAILLPDGSVLMGGDRVGMWKSGETTPSERYYPSYFSMPRPEITNAPPSTAYGAVFTVQTPSAASVAEAVLIRPGSVTHGFNMAQRFVECLVVSTAAGSIDVQAPPDGTVAQPGPYLLFLVTAGRVPSEGRWIHLG